MMIINFARDRISRKLREGGGGGDAGYHTVSNYFAKLLNYAGCVSQRRNVATPPCYLSAKIWFNVISIELILAEESSPTFTPM